MKIVTSGCKYIDIDAYGGIIAYAYLLNLKGIQAKAISTSPLNESITPTLLDLDVKLDEYEKCDDDEFIIVDVSNKEFFDDIVDEEKIIEVIDHRTGFKEYWENILKERAKIEFIGAAATLIVEEYEKENLLSSMPKNIALLLLAGILDNTLNLKAQVTTQRDIDACEKLMRIAGCTSNFAKEYFFECQNSIEADLEKSIENDTKVEKICDILPEVFGQLAVWSKDFIIDNKEIIYKTLGKISDTWAFNLIALSDGKSYIIASGEEYKIKLERLFGKSFVGDIMELDNVWLRKEIIKKARNATQ